MAAVERAFCSPKVIDVGVLIYFPVLVLVSTVGHQLRFSRKKHPVSTVGHVGSGNVFSYKHFNLSRP